MKKMSGKADRRRKKRIIFFCFLLIFLPFLLFPPMLTLFPVTAEGRVPLLSEDNEIILPLPEFARTTHRWQREFLHAFESGKYRFYLLNWHRRARKSTLILNVLIKEAWLHPNSTYVYVAPTYKQAKRILWNAPNMIKKWLPSDLIASKDSQELRIELKNGSQIILVGADDPDSLAGIDANGVVFDEWAKFKDDTAWTMILRPIIAQDISRWAIFIYTPKGQNHAYSQWIEAVDKKEYFRSMLRADESGLITAEELEKAGLDMPEPYFRQEFLCEFTADDENVLITQDMLNNLKGLNFDEIKVTKKAVAVDPSEGGDETVILAGENGKIVGKKYIRGAGKKIDQRITATEAEILMLKSKIKTVGVDGIGIGNSVLTLLNNKFEDDERYQVIDIQSAEAAEDNEKFGNKRAEMWWNAFEMIRDKEVPCPEDPELIRQLVNVRYVQKKGRIYIELKLDIKKKLGRSPDRADTFVYLLWLIKKIAPDETNYREERRKSRIEEMLQDEYEAEVA